MKTYVADGEGWTWVLFQHERNVNLWRKIDVHIISAGYLKILRCSYCINDKPPSTVSLYTEVRKRALLLTWPRGIGTSTTNKLEVFVLLMRPSLQLLIHSKASTASKYKQIVFVFWKLNILWKISFGNEVILIVT